MYRAPWNTWNSSSGNAIACAKLKFSSNLPSCSTDPLWGVCAIVKHCSNLCFSANNLRFVPSAQSFPEDLG